MDGSIRHNCQFEGEAFWDAQPVKADERQQIANVLQDDVSSPRTDGLAGVMYRWLIAML